MYSMNIRWGYQLLKVALIMCLVGIALLYVIKRAQIFHPTEISVHGKAYSIEIADTVAKQEQGLGEREGLCRSCAMLFVFDESPGLHAFWMKGMRFPLDIVWFKADTVVFIERHIEASSKETFAPEVVSDRVIEFNAGEADTLQVGDQAQYR